MVGKAQGEAALAKQQADAQQQATDEAQRIQAQKTVESEREIQRQRLEQQDKAERDRVDYEKGEAARREKAGGERESRDLLRDYSNSANQATNTARYYRQQATSAQVMGMSPVDRKAYQEYYNGLADKSESEAEQWKSQARGLNIPGAGGMFGETPPPPLITGTAPPAPGGVPPATATTAPAAPVAPTRARAPVVTQPTVKQTQTAAAGKRAEKRLSLAEAGQLNLAGWRKYLRGLYGEKLTDAEVNSLSEQNYRKAQIELGKGRLAESQKAERFREAHPRGARGIDQRASAGREASKLEGQLGDEKKFLAMDPDVRAARVRKYEAALSAAGQTIDSGFQKYLHRYIGAPRTSPGKSSAAAERRSSLKVLTEKTSQGFNLPSTLTHDPATPGGLKERSGAFQRVWERSTSPQREDLKVEFPLDYSNFRSNQPTRAATAGAPVRRAQGGPPVLPPVTATTAVPAFPGTEAPSRAAPSPPARAATTPARTISAPSRTTTAPPAAADKAKFSYQGVDYSPTPNAPAPKGIDPALWEKARTLPNPFQDKKGSPEWQVWQAFIGKGIPSATILKSPGFGGYSELITRIKKNYLGLGAQPAGQKPAGQKSAITPGYMAPANNDQIAFAKNAPDKWKTLSFPRGVTNVWGTSGNRGIARIGSRSYWMEVDDGKVVIGAPKGR
jgi:hypothetical protein